MTIQKLSMPRLKLLLLSAAILSMTGCTDRIGLAEQAMADIRNQPAQPIEPPPKAELVEDFVYSASAQRSPFLPPSLVNLDGVLRNSTIS